MTAIVEHTHELLQKHGLQRGDTTALPRAKRLIEQMIVPSQAKKAVKAAEEYLGIVGV